VNVQFEDQTIRSGIAALAGPGLGVACVDLTGDGSTDIVVANDNRANRLWVNQRDGTFQDEALVRSLAFDRMGETEGNMGIAVADIDNDQRLDVVLTHLTSQTLGVWKQDATGLFRDLRVPTGLTHAKWRGTGWGVTLTDFDHDGWVDLAVVNGAVVRSKGTRRSDDAPFAAYAERNQVFQNLKDGILQDISDSQVAFCGQVNNARGMAWGDLNGDGAIDLVVSQIDGPVRLFYNQIQDRGNWLMIWAVDPRYQRDAIGALVVVQANGTRYMRQIDPAGSYASSNAPLAHFGLGAAKSVDVIEIRWPDGLHEQFRLKAMNQRITLRRGAGSK